MQLCVLGSGSSGNCTYIGTAHTHLLLDLGFGARSLRRRFEEAALSLDKVQALILTHGHSDHVAGAAAFADELGIPVFMNKGTRDEVPKLRELERWECFEAGQSFSIGDIRVHPFDVNHDAAQPVAFRFSSGGVSGAAVTDLGELSPLVTKQLRDCDWLILESNHDEEMLKVGGYPWFLKQRLLGREGHLSNQALSHFLAEDFDGSAAHLFLAHLSRNNNLPELAAEAASAALQKRRRDGYPSPQVHLTHQHKPTIVLEL